jgi:SagB-type dehydrogenase family enzyme
MARSKEADIARLYHRHSSNVRSREIETSFDGDREPLRFRTYPGAERAALPGRDFDVAVPLGAVLSMRRSCREFALRPLPLATLGRLLHACYGVRGRRRIGEDWILERPAPSAGGRYPIEIYVATQAVEGLVDGIHHYDPRAHELELVRPGVAHGALAELAMGQDMIRDVNVVVIMTAIPERTTWKYGQRGYRFVFLDAGHLGQNLYLVATALGLGPVTLGGFFDRELAELLRLPEGEEAIYLACIGQPRPEGGEAR